MENTQSVAKALIPRSETLNSAGLRAKWCVCCVGWLLEKENVENTGVEDIVVPTSNSKHRIYFSGRSSA